MTNNSHQKLLLDEIDILNREAWQKRMTDSNAAQTTSNSVIEKSRLIHYQKGLAEGLRTQGFCMIRLSFYNEAEACLKEALAIFENLNDTYSISSVYEYLGIVHRNWGNLGTSLEYIDKAITLSQRAGNTENETTHYYQLGVTFRSLGNYEKALDHLFKSLSLARSINFSLLEGYAINVIGSVYFEVEDYESALDYYQQGLKLRRVSGDKWGEAGSLDNIGFVHSKMRKWEKAVEYCEQGLAINKITGDKKGEANALVHIAEVHKQTGNFKQAEHYAKESLQIRQAVGDRKGEAEVLLFLSELQLANYDPASMPLLLEEAITALKIAEEIKATDLLSRAHFILYDIYRTGGEFELALSQLELHINLEKQLHKDAINQKIVNLQISHRTEEAKKEAEIFRLRNVELAALYEESNRQRQEIELQKQQAETTLSELKATQKQLIQSEKMASLGELTAGIAHEIQNPLNFVNNFSEVNTELIEELKSQNSKVKNEEQDELLNDIFQNNEKINHHGKRADAIIKGMLQHSRSSSGVKEATDINALCDEYLRLSYHGLRAKDKSFNATIKTDFDASIGNINVIPQDLGRVILNLLTNAFYAVDEKKKSPRPLKGSLDLYEPLVTVTTRRLGSPLGAGGLSGGLLISVTDNGSGIPPSVLEKIFQPFFTTKPTGQGTGLGLSMSYDIVTKGHNGQLKVETKEGEGTMFTIILPI